MSKYEITVRQFREFTEATGYVTTAERETMPFGRGSVTWPDPDHVVRSEVNWKYDERGRLLQEPDYDRPVIFISWTDASAFAEWMGCRLPTEAEWEYACRAGTTTPFNTGEKLGTEQANYYGLYPYNTYDYTGLVRDHPTPVGSFEPNNWGLYDMHGNVTEWCSDWYAYDYPEKVQKDPAGPSKGYSRVARGGSWCTDAMDCRSASRYARNAGSHTYDSGFRIVKDNR